MIQNEDEERKEEVKLSEDSAATSGEDPNLGDPAVVTSSSSREMKPSLGAVAKRTSPRNKQKPSTDRLGKATSKTGHSKPNSKPNSTLVAKIPSREGQEVCDFIRHLPEVPLKILFSYLSGRDICRVVQVGSLLSSLSPPSSFITFSYPGFYHLEVRLGAGREASH